MSKPDVLTRAKVILDQIEKQTPASRSLMREDSVGFGTTRARQLRAAAESGDQEMFNQIMDDVTAPLGPENAEIWKNTILGD